MRLIRHIVAVSGFLLAGAVCLAQSLQSPPTAQLTLRRAIELALRNSREISQAKFQVALAEHRTGVDRSPFLPYLSTGSGAEYSSGFPLAPGGGIPAVFLL